MTEEQELKIKNDYLNGIKYKEICEKYNITQNQLRAVIRKYKLTRTKSNAQKGNQNAKGNKGGHAPPKNKNAVVTGEYATIYKDVLTEDEKAILNGDFIIDKQKILENDIRMLFVRELRMLKRIEKLQANGKDMTVSAIKDKNTKHYGNTADRETTSELEPTINAVQRIEEGINRVLDTRRKCIESLDKLNNKNQNADNEKDRIQIINDLPTEEDFESEES